MKDTPAKTLLEIAKDHENKSGGSGWPDDQERQELELALAYHSGLVHSGAMAAALGIEQTAGVTAWFSSVMMRGIRRGQIAVSLNEQAFKPKEVGA